MDRSSATESRPLVRSYKFRAYLTKPQESRARALLRANCDLYNAALQHRQDSWNDRKVSVSFFEQHAELKHIREDPQLGRWSSQAQMRVLRQIQYAYDGFFRRVKAGEAPGHPRYKSYKRWDSAVHTAGNGSKWMSKDDVGGKWARTYFKGVGHVKTKQHRPVDGKVKTVTLKRENVRWFVILVVEHERPEPLPATGKTVGLDVGVNRFAVVSDGTVIENPRFLHESAVELAALQRLQASTKKGTSQYRLLRRKIAKLHRKIRNRRRDFQHKTVHNIVNTYDAVAIEDLNIPNMSRKAKPKPDPDIEGNYLPNGAAAKTGLNRSILDAGWGQFRSLLEAKAEWAGRQITRINPAYTSITCHQCGATSVREPWDTITCPTHGPIDADLNAAHNIHQRAGFGSRNHQEAKHDH